MLITDYSSLMTEEMPYIELTLDLREPAELADMVDCFAAIASQFELFIKREHPNLKGAAKLFMRDICHGSIIVQLVPLVLPLIENMDRAIIVDGFVRRFGGLLTRYTSGEKEENLTKSEIKDLLGAVTLIANDPEGKSAISSFDYSKTKSSTRISVQFDTDGAKRARETLQLQRAALDLAAYEVFENRLLVFVQTTVKAAETGRRTSLRAIIETVHPKPLAVTFETDLARERIEGEIREDERNVYKKGFFVDCYTERLNGKPVAYRITAVRDIIPLPDDE